MKKAVLNIIKYLPIGHEIISGGQKKGVDGWVRHFSIIKGHKYLEFPPDHYKQDKYSAQTCPITNKKIIYGQVYSPHFYHLRNERMAVYAQKNNGFAFAFNLPDSKGTQSFLKFANKHKLNHHIFNADGTEQSIYYINGKIYNSNDRFERNNLSPYNNDGEKQ